MKAAVSADRAQIAHSGLPVQVQHQGAPSDAERRFVDASNLAIGDADAGQPVSGIHE
jgi:hypothetical protein